MTSALSRIFTRTTDPAPQIPHGKPARAVEDRVLDLEAEELEDHGTFVTVTGVLVRAGVVYRYDDDAGVTKRELFGPSAFAGLSLANARLSLYSAPRRPGQPQAALASTRAGSLRVSLSRGTLAVEFDLDLEDYVGASVASAYRRGDLDCLGMSFQAIRESSGELRLVRTLKEVKVLSLFVPFEDATVTPES